jgi:hypothetical protein
LTVRRRGIVARLQFTARPPAQQGLLAAHALVRRGGHPRAHGHLSASLVHGDHREEAAVDMTDLLRPDVLGEHLDADLHRRAADMVDRRQEGHQFAHMDRLPEHHLIHADRHDVGTRVAARAGVGHLVEQLQQRAAMDVAREVGDVRRH